MITAHLPLEYLLACGLRAAPVLPVAAVMTGAVFPDIDLLWFFLVDDGAIHHHRYWVHIPAFWAVLAVIALPLLRCLSGYAMRLGALFLAGVGLHILLDSIAGDILWLWPMSDTMYALTRVPAGDHHYLIAFLTHWTFLLELLIWATALVLMFRNRKARP